MAVTTGTSFIRTLRKSSTQHQDAQFTLCKIVEPHPWVPCRLKDGGRRRSCAFWTGISENAERSSIDFIDFIDFIRFIGKVSLSLVYFS